MKIITKVWTWIRIQIRDLRPQLRLCLRVTVAALVSFVLGKSLSIPFGGLWAMLTAVVVTQTSVGGSLKATIEYLIGTLGGAVYAGVIAVLIRPANEISLLIALAIAVAPLALLAAINTNLLLTFWQSKRPPVYSISWPKSCPKSCPSSLLASPRHWMENLSCESRTVSARHSHDWPRSRPKRCANGWPILLRRLTLDRCCKRCSGCATTLS